MQSALPLDVLADELGAAAGRIERELRLKDEARAARFEARLAAIELAAFKAEEERQRIFAERLAELRNGRDGEPGKDGKEPDFGPVFAKFDEFAHKENECFDVLEGALRSIVNAKIAEVDAKLAEVKDGRDGKDADIEPLIKHVQVVEELSVQHIELLSKELTDKVNAKLAEVKDGRDGEPGKDADIEPVLELVDGIERKHRSFLESLEYDLSTRIDATLAEVKDGKDGEPGPEGPAGKDGKLPIAREWTSRVHYAGDVVRHAGSTYQALTDTGQQPPHSDWGELASRGTDGRGFVLRGLYNATADYRQHDIVMISRNSFAAKYDNPGECPGEGWQLFACSGYKGKEGPPGPAGAKGADGRSVSIVKWEADPDEMVLRIADSTGNTFAVDLQPIAERIVEAAR
jgi:hypothetical protein